MREDSKYKLMNNLLDIGEAMIDCGAEVIRVEDTVSRIGYAYEVNRMDVFVITSCINITMEFQDGTQLTKVRRFRKMTSIDLAKLERINALSREICIHPISTEELQKRVDDILQRKIRKVKMLCGYIYNVFWWKCYRCSFGSMYRCVCMRVSAVFKSNLYEFRGVTVYYHFFGRICGCCDDKCCAMVASG